MRTKIIVKDLVIACSICLILFGIYHDAKAAFQNSPPASNTYFWNVFSQGGYQRNSSNYRLTDTVSQNSPLGLSESNAYKLRSGFWPAFSYRPSTPSVPENPSPGSGGTSMTLLGFTGNLPTINILGYISEPCTLATADDRLKLDIAGGTRLLNSAGTRLDEFTVAPVSPVHPTPESNNIVLAYDLGPIGATFDPPISLTLNYNGISLPPDAAESSLYIAWWNGNSWQTLTSTVNIITKTVTANVSHFTEFALFGTVKPSPILVPIPTSTSTPISAPTPPPTPTLTPMPTITPTPTPASIPVQEPLSPFQKFSWAIIGTVIGLTVVAIAIYGIVRARRRT